MSSFKQENNMYLMWKCRDIASARKRNRERQTDFCRENVYRCSRYTWHVQEIDIDGQRDRMSQSYSALWKCCESHRNKNDCVKNFGRDIWVRDECGLTGKWIKIHHSLSLFSFSITNDLSLTQCQQVDVMVFDMSQHWYHNLHIQ